MNILIIEDEILLANAIRTLFEKNNFIVQVTLDGKNGLTHALSNLYDLIILDLALPELDGFELISQIRRQGIKTPILCLTAKVTLSDELLGLNLGADDYLTKPVSFQKLLAHARSLIRRGDLINPSILTYGNTTLNIDTCELSVKSEVIRLPIKEFHLMSLLMRKHEYYVSKEEIGAKIWGYESDLDYNSVEVYLSFLRKKLKTLGSNLIIKVNRRVGYRIEVSSD